MKKNQLKKSIILLFGAALLVTFSNCGKSEEEIIEEITPVMTAKIKGEVWTTKVAAGVNSTLYVISGTKDKEIIALTIPSKTIGVYTIDGLNNIATFIPDYDTLANTYYAYEGTIDLKTMNTIRTQVNGTFEFTAVNSSLDTIHITEGTFKNIPTK